MHKLGLLTIVLALFAMCAAGGYLPSGKKIIGYWGCNPGEHKSTLPQLQTALTKGYNVMIFAFYLVDASGDIFIDPGSVASPTKAAIRNNGQFQDFSYLISLFGGEKGAAQALTLDPNTWAQNMFNKFVALSNIYGFDGIDIDLENAWGGTPDKVICGLRAFFKLMHRNGYVVSMAPQTTAVTPEVGSYQAANWNSYVPLLDTSIIDYVDIVAIQLYNNAIPMGGAAAYTKSLTEGFKINGCPSCDGVTGIVKIPASKLAHGWPSAVGAAPGGCSPGPCPYGAALTVLYGASQSLRSTAGVMTWSIEWDEVGSWSFIHAASVVKFLDNVIGGFTPAPTAAPTPAPTSAPTPAPTSAPTPAPTSAPTPAPTRPPTAAPTSAPTPAPTSAPTPAPTSAPTPAPTSAPTPAPTAAPTPAPTRAPTSAPTPAPTSAPTPAPTTAPTSAPPPTSATTKPGKCSLLWTQTVDASYGTTANRYQVSMTASGKIKGVQFSITPAPNTNEWWGISRNATTGFFQFDSWVYTQYSGAAVPAGSPVMFGYTVPKSVTAVPVIKVANDPCV